MNQDPDLEKLESAVELLMEHFEAVQIFASRYDSETGTTSVTSGRGNWNARRGQVAEFNIRQNELDRDSVRHTDD